MTEGDSTKKPRSPLVPIRYMQQDFFIADTFDCAVKDDTSSMEHPVFALKAGDTKDRHYSHNGNTIDIRATSVGLPTIHDKDIWIYCISKLMAAINNNEPISRTIRFTAYDYLVTTNRDTGGVNYERLRDSLERLNGTSITTNIVTGGRREAAGFGLIDSWRIIEEDPNTERMISLEVTLPDWLYRSVSSLDVLTISPDYFRIRKPLDRRIYELARKHCGNQASWSITLPLLLKKSGSTSNIREFRRSIKTLAESDELPDYRIKYDVEADIVTAYNRGTKGFQAEFKSIVKTMSKAKSR
jgi:plasmid replication initiation protein